MAIFLESLSGRQDSNLRPPGPKPGALPIAPRPENRYFHTVKYSTYDLTRTFVLKRCANLVLFFKNNNKLAHECTQFVVIYRLDHILRLFFLRRFF